MKYFVTLAGKEREIDVRTGDGGKALVRVDGVETPVDAVFVPGGVHILWDGHGYDVALGGKAPALSVAAGAFRGEAHVVSERERVRERRGAAGPGKKEVRAPMPGRVVKLLVAAGDTVEAGQPLVVVEAMKMENEIRAPLAGRIAKVAVATGASVEGQAILVVFE